MANTPPWIFLLLLVAPTRSNEISTTPSSTTITHRNSDDNATLLRPNRGTSDREHRLIQQYPTYYLAHSYTDEAGERRNVLIPVQAGSTTETPRPEGPSTASPETADYNNAYSSPGAQFTQNSLIATTNPLLAHAMLLRLQSAGLLPASQSPASSDYPLGPASAMVYAYRPQSKAIKPQHPLQYPPLHNLKYGSNPVKFSPYTSHKLQYKVPPAKLYNLDVPHRFRPRSRPDKNKYTATKLQFSLNTTPSPYLNKVRFELEDARVPMSHSIALLPVSMPQTTPHTLADTTASGLSQYLESEMPKQYYPQHRPQVQYIQVPQREALEGRPQPTAQPQIEPQHIQYIHGNEMGPSTETLSNRPEVHYTQSTPSPSTHPATLQQHFVQHEQSNPEHHQQIQYVSVTDIEVGSPSPSTKEPQQEVQYVQVPEQSSIMEPSTQQPQQEIQYVRVPEENRQPHQADEEDETHIQYVDSNRPSPQPQINFASDNGDLRASPQPQEDYVGEGDVKSTVQPQIQYHEDVSNELPSPDPHIQYTPTTPSHIQYVTQSGTMRTPTHHHQVQYEQDTNDVTPTPQPQPQYQYVTENNQVTPTPQSEVPYEPPKFPPVVQDAYNILKQTNQLPQSITPDNIDGSIKTLALILQRLQQAENVHKYRPTIAPVIVKPKEPIRAQVGHPSKQQKYPQASGGSTPGRAGIDYPIYSKIPKTSFDCSTQRYKGFFGDPETHCQVWHYCDLNGGQASFLCPNGTVFNQVALTCDWWFNVKCSSTSQLYVLNERLYKYILPFSPSFPEDYSGPVVDRYLTAKFKEQEAKNKIKALKALITTPPPDNVSPSAEAATEPST